MATVTTVNLIDDFTGEIGANTIEFTVNGVKMEIEMTPETYEKMFGAIINKARVRKNNDSPRARNIRAWLTANNIEHSSKGRLKNEHIKMFNASQVDNGN